MQILKDNLKIDFMGKRKLALIISLILIIISIGAMFARGLNLGIDFTGGTLVEVGEKISVSQKLNSLRLMPNFSAMSFASLGNTMPTESTTRSNSLDFILPSWM